MRKDRFVRIVTGASAVAHVPKEKYPNESLCGRVLDPTPVNPRGRRKCVHCQTSVTNQEAGK